MEENKLEWQLKQLEHEEMLRSKGFRVSETTSTAKGYVGNIGLVIRNKLGNK